MYKFKIEARSKQSKLTKPSTRLLLLHTIPRIATSIMASKPEPSKSVLLLLDFEDVILRRGDTTNMLSQTEKLVAACRKKGITIAHCRVAFDEIDKKSIPQTNIAFASFASNPEQLAAMDVDSPITQFHARVSPQKGDLVYRKNRYGPLMVGPSAAMHGDFQKHGFDTVFVAGLATGGAVLSFVRQAADLDYRLYVLDDCCQDHEVEVHNFLMAKIFPKQAHVIKSAEIDTVFDTTA